MLYFIWPISYLLLTFVGYCMNYFFCAQQLGNIATTGENARRYFHAVAGDKDNQGELFGIENTFRLTTGERSVTEDIFQVGN